MIKPLALVLSVVMSMAQSIFPQTPQVYAAGLPEENLEPPSIALPAGSLRDIVIIPTPVGLTKIVVGTSNDELQRIEAERKALAYAEQQAERKRTADIAKNRAWQAAHTAAPAVVAAPTDGIREIARQRIVAKWGEEHWEAFNAIVTRESGWNPNAVNASSGACGLGQALPCSKMGGMDVANQLNWIIGYIEARYGNPNAAWSFWQAHNWY